MTHLPYIAGAYGLALVVAGGLSLAAALRLRRVQRRLAALQRQHG